MIERMTEQDLPTVVELYTVANAFATREDIMRWTGNNLRDFPQFCNVYTSPELIGAISGYFHNGVGTIDDLAVDEDCRMRGVGSRLLSYELRQFQSEGIHTVQLWVHKANYDAIPFYKKHGFTVVQEERTSGIEDVPDGELITLMETHLS